MLLRAVECRGYKGFSNQTRLTLSNITVLFGKNNSGKTTLARLPIFALASMSNAESMYALSHDRLVFGSSFLGLASVDQPHPSIYFGLEWPDEGSVGISLQHVISRLDPDSVQADFIRIDDVAEMNFDLLPAPRPSVYDQLMNSISAEQQGRLNYHIDSARAILAEVIHVPSIRPRIDTTYTTRRSGGQTVDEVPYLLANQRALLERVDDWFMKNFDGTHIGIDQAAFAFQLAEMRNSVPVNLAESGRGLQSALTVVALLLAIADDKAAKLVVIEEPEAHLHPSVHGAMADLVIACSQRSQVIVETHSENFILRLRRRIAEGQIANTDVGLHYLDESRLLTSIPLDESGSTDSWPSGVFESDVEEARAIVEAKVTAMNNLRSSS